MHNVQDLIMRLKLNAESHVLLVTRHLENMRDDKYDLTQLPHKELKPFEDVDKIINMYCLKHKDSFKWANTIKKSIKKIAENDLWLLSFALQGCKDAKGKGEPLTWLETGVQSKLENIRNTKVDNTKLKPDILLALSPLYMTEISTYKSFLINHLNFNPDDIDRLVDYGEIIEHKEYGECCYRLPHSSLAKAYWEHGKGYREGFPEYEDFIYDYAISNVPNGLKAISTLDVVTTCNIGKSLGAQLIEKLEQESDIERILEKEQTINGILYWMQCRHYTTDSHNIIFTCKINNTILNILANKINLTKSLHFACRCIYVLNNLSIAALKAIDTSPAKELLGFIDWADILVRNNGHLSMEDIICFEATTHQASSGFFLKCCQSLYDKGIKFRCFWDSAIFFSIQLDQLNNASQVNAEKFCELLDLEYLAIKLKPEKNTLKNACILTLYDTSETTGKELIKQIYGHEIPIGKFRKHKLT